LVVGFFRNGKNRDDPATVAPGETLDHRRLVGGLWDEMGPLQLDFLVSQGLSPNDALLDVGCGSLRAGIHFVRYLEPGGYYGLDINQPLLDAGREELSNLGLDPGLANLIRDDAFRFSRFERTFRWALAQSVFTHLPLNTIMRCLSEIESVLEPGGRFYATFFENTGRRLSTSEIQEPDGVVTHLDSDSFFYDPDVFRWCVEGSTLRCELIGDWQHPRNQKMLVFTKSGEAHPPTS
jgi:SAM-dependent methyltransferase